MALAPPLIFDLRFNFFGGTEEHADEGQLDRVDETTAVKLLVEARKKSSAHSALAFLTRLGYTIGQVRK